MGLKMKNTIMMAFILTSLMASRAWSQAKTQDSDVEELNLIQLELDKNAAPQVNEDDSTSETAPLTRQQQVDAQKASPDISNRELSRLTDFKQVSVIQKRYLPRTGRFQAFVGPSITLNDPWFNVLGASVKLGYNFTEAWGIEGNYSFMSTDKTMALKELSKENNITTENFVYVKSYYTLGVNWTPLYGKMTWLNEKIVYYDTYFGLGMGATEIQNGIKEDTFSINAGQIFSVTKGQAFRWDLTWNFFEAKQVNSSQGTYNNVIISAGFSFFFPEANYR